MYYKFFLTSQPSETTSSANNASSMTTSNCSRTETQNDTVFSAKTNLPNLKEPQTKVITYTAK